MIVIPRGLARSVRALARQCVSGRPRGPAPPVVFENRAGTLTIVVRTADAALARRTYRCQSCPFDRATAGLRASGGT